MSGLDRESLWSEIEGWITIAEADRLSAELLLARVPGVASFHCQQAAEKLLKALLVLGGRPIQKTHDLSKLSRQVTALYPDLADLASGMREWSVWNIAYRYPSADVDEPLPTPEELSEALATIDRLIMAVRSLRG